MQAKTSTFGLIDRVKNGDYEAFTLLFDKYRRRLAVLIHYKLSPEVGCFVEVDDILQETFFKAFRDVGNFTYQSSGSFLRWLSRIADHVIVDLARFHMRQRRHAEEVVRFRSESNPEGPEPVDTRTPSRVLSEKQGLLALLDKLSALPDDYREVILLAKVEGLSTREMAERLGKSREAVALLLHRAIKRLRRLDAPPVTK
jgi:RNA polymerase sigma-70 factor (ECF subfamily)